MNNAVTNTRLSETVDPIPFVITALRLVLQVVAVTGS